MILFTGTRIRTDSVMCPRSSNRGAIQVPQLQLITVNILIHGKLSIWYNEANYNWKYEYTQNTAAHTHTTDLQLKVRESTRAFGPQFDRQPAQTRQRSKCIGEQFGIDWHIAEVFRQRDVSQIHKSSQQYQRSLGPVKRQWKHDKIWHGRGEQIEEANEVALTMMSLEHQVSHVTCRPRGTDRLPGVRPFSWGLRPNELRDPHLMAPWNLGQHRASYIII